ncbi:MAG: molybdopterin converting factor subunit 1 [Alphaproteobacteria bacterium]|nr:molybdopterin converting factor subunit 1 [Alphaproteobacteria bacterium]
MRLLYFAWVRTRIGLAEEEVSPPSHVTTLGELVAWLGTRGPGHAAAFANHSALRFAVNQEYVGLDGKISPGDEIAVFPPVTGGRT